MRTRMALHELRGRSTAAALWRMIRHVRRDSLPVAEVLEEAAGSSAALATAASDRAQRGWLRCRVPSMRQLARRQVRRRITTAPSR